MTKLCFFVGFWIGFNGPSRSDRRNGANPIAGQWSTTATIASMTMLPTIPDRMVTSFTVPKGDVAALTTALDRLMADAPLRARLDAHAEQPCAATLPHRTRRRTSGRIRTRQRAA